MANHTVPEDIASTSHQRADSRSPSLDSQGNVRFPPEFPGTSTFAASAVTMSEIGPGGVGASNSNVPSSTGIIKEGLGSLNRWSQSTTSSKSPPNNHVGHCRGNSTLPDYDDYSGPDSPDSCVSPTSNTISQSLCQTINTYNTHPERSLNPCLSESRGQTELPTLALSEQVTSPASTVNGTGSFQSQSKLVPGGPLSSNLSQGHRVHEPKNDKVNAVNDSIETNHVVQSHSQHVKEIDSAIDDHTPQLVDSESSRGKRYRGHSQKAMLSKALQKANTAVLLDNAANFEGAMDAYSEACQLLQLVMLRSSGGSGEKLKLQEIRDTYMIRINELQGMELSLSETESKALPERPASDESSSDLFQPLEDEDRQLYGTNMSSLYPGSRFNHTVSEDMKSLALEQIPPRRQSLLPSPLDDELQTVHGSPMTNRSPGHFPSKSSMQVPCDDHLQRTGSGLNGVFLASPQTPDRSDMGANPNLGSQYSMPSLLSATAGDSNESTSWLDTIDESGASSPSSQRSHESSLYLRHRQNSHCSNGTEAEFDAALDAAVEAAYDEGLEPAVESGDSVNDDDIVANARRNVELAKQRVREAEREAAVAMTRGLGLRRIQEQVTAKPTGHDDSDYLDEESEEEERLLEEMTRGYVMDDFEFDVQSKSALPRQSDSGGFLARTWENSAKTNPETVGVLSTLVEDDVLPSTGPTLEPMPSAYEVSKSSSDASIPSDVAVPPKPPSSLSPKFGPSVRERRLSGQNPRQLKIETSPRGRAAGPEAGLDQPRSPFAGRPPPISKDEPQVYYKDPVPVPESRNAVGQNKRSTSIGSLAEDNLTNASLSKTLTHQDEYGVSNMAFLTRPIGKVPSAPDNLGKRNLNQKPSRARNVSVPIPDVTADSPGTPSSSIYPTLDFHKGAVTNAIPIPPTPTGGAFAQDSLPSGGLHLFDSLIHSPSSPGFPNPMTTNAPVHLEPCPESFLLRPFWLMRCIYQSIANPCGGYLSTKLFVPRDIWNVKNVKLKAIEEKISNCDLLTAALLKLAQVDTFDADAVLEEMQALEGILDQVQVALSKKLGNDVGVQGAMPLFKPSSVSDDATTVGDSLPSRASNGPSKSYLTSWRKLRSKNSGIGTTTAPSSSKETGKDNLTFNSIPMTSASSSQSAKRNVTQLQLNGPNANYMGALARLCDAAQVLDQIAQQVEDPGLKHSSQTLVGLELSTRHAAEFFGFFVCRFVLNDVGMMLDKFIKRGSEWALV